MSAGVSLAIQLVLALVNQAGAISAVIQKAQAENRDLTPEELDSLVSSDDTARAALVAAINAAKTGAST